MSILILYSFNEVNTLQSIARASFKCRVYKRINIERTVHLNFDANCQNARPKSANRPARTRIFRPTNQRFVVTRSRAFSPRFITGSNVHL